MSAATEVLWVITGPEGDSRVGYGQTRRRYVQECEQPPLGFSAGSVFVTTGLDPELVKDPLPFRLLYDDPGEQPAYTGLISRAAAEGLECEGLARFGEADVGATILEVDGEAII